MYSLALIFTFIKTIHYSQAFHELTLKVIRYNMLSSPFGGFIRKIGKEKRNCKKKTHAQLFLEFFTSRFDKVIEQSLVRSRRFSFSIHNKRRRLTQTCIAKAKAVQ